MLKEGQNLTIWISQSAQLQTTKVTQHPTGASLVLQFLKFLGIVQITRGSFTDGNSPSRLVESALEPPFHGPFRGVVKLHGFQHWTVWVERDSSVGWKETGNIGSRSGFIWSWFAGTIRKFLTKVFTLKTSVLFLAWNVLLWTTSHLNLLFFPPRCPGALCSFSGGHWHQRGLQQQIPGHE